MVFNDLVLVLLNLQLCHVLVQPSTVPVPLTVLRHVLDRGQVPTVMVAGKVVCVHQIMCGTTMSVYQGNNVDVFMMNNTIRYVLPDAGQFLWAILMWNQTYPNSFQSESFLWLVKFRKKTLGEIIRIKLFQKLTFWNKQTFLPVTRPMNFYGLAFQKNDPTALKLFLNCLLE